VEERDEEIKTVLSSKSSVRNLKMKEEQGDREKERVEKKREKNKNR